MSFYRWLQNLGSALAPGPDQRNHGPRGSHRATRHWPSFEVLEDRCLLSFTPAASFAAGAPLATGDFNNDGQFDLVTSNGSSVSVRLGNGDGTFQPAQSFTTGPATASVAVGDFNGDGNLDLAAADYDYYFEFDKDIRILIGHGDGTFAPAVPVSSGTSLPLQSITAADLNDDGKPDLVVLGDYDDNFGAASVCVLIGQGGGEFAPAVRYRPYLIEPPLALGDFDSDGNLDVAAASSSPSAKILFGNGDGTLRQFNGIFTTLGARSVAVGDFDTDGNLDLVIIGYVTGANILLGKGDGSFQAAHSINTGGFGSLIAADVSGDGVLDLVVTSAGGVSVVLGNGDGSFAPPIATAAGTYLSYFVVADFNGDGRPDVAAWGSNTMSVLLNNGDWGPNPLPGDYNANGTVDAADYSVWRNAVGSHVANYSGADGNGNGVVDSADYDVWKSHYGMTLPEPAAGSGAAVPTSSAVAIQIQEPAALAQVPSESPSASAKSIPTAEFETSSRRQDSGSRSRGPIGHFRVNKVGGDDLLLLAIDRAGRTPQREFPRSRDNGNEKPRTDKGHNRNQIDEPLAVAPSADLAEVFAHNAHERSSR
jgi:FG-GAP-like repeat/Dockerin type I domain